MTLRSESKTVGSDGRGRGPERVSAVARKSGSRDGHDDAAANATDARLFAEAKHDRAALAALYDRHSETVFGLARAILRDHEQASDLTQEIFVDLVTDDRFDPDRGALIAYMIARTRSRALDRVRSRGRHARLLDENAELVPVPTESARPDDRLLGTERQHRVHEALGTLSKREREVVEYSYFHGMTQPEIAERLEAPLGSVKSWARRGLLSLRKCLSDLESSDG